MRRLFRAEGKERVLNPTPLLNSPGGREGETKIRLGVNDQPFHEYAIRSGGMTNWPAAHRIPPPTISEWGERVRLELWGAKAPL